MSDEVPTTLAQTFRCLMFKYIGIQRYDKFVGMKNFRYGSRVYYYNVFSNKRRQKKNFVNIFHLWKSPKAITW